MVKWVRFESEGQVGFGQLASKMITVHDGDMFDDPVPNGNQIALADVTLLTPCVPSKLIGLWNNSRALGEMLGSQIPDEPLCFHKSSNAYLAPGGAIQRPAAYSGRVIFEGELGIVIGRTCKELSADEASSAIFGYTCVNDVTAFDIIGKDPTFAQWARAKSFDTFAPFGPAIGTNLTLQSLHVRTIVNGDERQYYPVTDLLIPPYEIVSQISQEMTLFAGDIIACGTSIGAGAMKEPHNTVSVEIEGVGKLENTFENS